MKLGYRLLFYLAGGLAIYGALHVAVLKLGDGVDYPGPDTLETAPGLNHYKFGDGDGYNYYRSEFPENFVESSPLIVYFHGAGADEKQGVDKLATLRRRFGELGFGYVSPRHYEFADLRQHLFAEHGRRPLHLIGGSRGGREVLEELIRHPGWYAGAILLCPAVVDVERYDLSQLSAPIFIVVGDADAQCYPGCQDLARRLQADGRAVKLTIVPGGDHSSPYLAGGGDWADEAIAHVFEPLLLTP